MTKLNVDFDSIPDRYVPLEPGIYTMFVEEIDVVDNKKGDGQNVVVKLRVSDPTSPMDGRMLTDYISLKGKPIALKRLVKSCGVTIGPDGINTDDLAGKVCRVQVKSRPYKDTNSGVMKEAAGVEQYLFDE